MHSVRCYLPYQVSSLWVIEHKPDRYVISYGYTTHSYLSFIGHRDGKLYIIATVSGYWFGFKLLTRERSTIHIPSTLTIWRHVGRIATLINCGKGPLNNILLITFSRNDDVIKIKCYLGAAIVCSSSNTICFCAFIHTKINGHVWRTSDQWWCCISYRDDLCAAGGVTTLILCGPGTVDRIYLRTLLRN